MYDYYTTVYMLHDKIIVSVIFQFIEGNNYWTLCLEIYIWNLNLIHRIPNFTLLIYIKVCSHS